MGEYTDPCRDFHEDDNEEEEALSLCDLPLQYPIKTAPEMASNHTRRSSSEQPSDQLFEFFSNFSSEMCSAEDIIFCGKLIPFRDASPPPQPDKRRISFRRRSESLSGLNSTVSRSNTMMRSSRSLDYRKLDRFSSSKTSSDSEILMDRNSSSKSTARTVAKPRWYVLMFGVVKPPKGMELRDIKSRQVRGNYSNVMLPPSAVDSGKKPPAGKSSSSSCKLLKVLSCRDPASVAVTTSFYIPPA
ncbi:uncharacterized protein LOC126668786 [Mercurialis annua]|uniref:uncharacterized protein LOC126668786 n=1 Tax=Mercurialis annua TaxID=3986 RepID=UPI00215EC896|nr:uncharacterized protein LOC126668786 [Mercurialis annua]